MDEFRFNTKLDQAVLLGVKVRNVEDLLESIRTVPGSSIYFHTHRFLQQHHYLSPEPPNDFAYWASNVLGDDILGEQLSSVDIVQFRAISELREAFVGILSDYLKSSERRIDSPPGEEFHFMASRTFVFATPYVVVNLAEFREVLAKVSINSLYYHIFDAALRLEKGENEFSRWFRDLGNVALAEETERLDPYRHTLDGLRKRILIMTRRDGTA